MELKGGLYTMTDLLGGAKLAYNMACYDFNVAGEIYNKNHIKVHEGIINYNSEEALRPFICLCNVIHKSIEVYVRLNSNDISVEDKKFMSGVMHVDNILKHENNTTVEIWDFVRTHPKFEVKGVGGKISANVQTAFFFQDISFIPISGKNEKKRMNYNLYIKDNDVVDIINRITKIIFNLK